VNQTLATINMTNGGNTTSQAIQQIIDPFLSATNSTQAIDYIGATISNVANGLMSNSTAPINPTTIINDILGFFKPKGSRGKSGN